MLSPIGQVFRPDLSDINCTIIVECLAIIWIYTRLRFEFYVETCKVKLFSLTLFASFKGSLMRIYELKLNVVDRPLSFSFFHR